VMNENRVSAVPVLGGGGELIGIVTEEDLLLKEAGFRDDVRLLEGPRRRRERQKSEGLVAEDLMTAPVVTTRPEATLAEAARRMHERQVKRLPVVDASGRLVGIVSRSDLLRVFVRPDAFIERDVREEVLMRHFADQAAGISATVQQGIVRLIGAVERRSDLDVLLELVDGIDGVVGIDDRLAARVDDLARPGYVEGAVGTLDYPFTPTLTATGEARAKTHAPSGR
jgi:CBS-domain-containing membrane protein